MSSIYWHCEFKQNLIGQAEDKNEYSISRYPPDIVLNFEKKNIK